MAKDKQDLPFFKKNNDDKSEERYFDKDKKNKDENADLPWLKSKKKQSFGSDKPRKWDDKPERKERTEKPFFKKDKPFKEERSFKGDKDRKFEKKEFSKDKPFQKDREARKSFGDRDGFKKREGSGFEKFEKRTNNSEERWGRKDGENRKSFGDRDGFKKRDGSGFEKFEKRTNNSEERWGRKDGENRQWEPKSKQSSLPWKRERKPFGEKSRKFDATSTKSEAYSEFESFFFDENYKGVNSKKLEKKTNKSSVQKGGEKVSLFTDRYGSTKQEERKSVKEITKNKKVPKKEVPDESKVMRLNKFVAQAGICSRRKAADLVKGGEILVNGQVQLSPGYEVQDNDKVTYQGEVLSPKIKLVYFLMNKPKGVITTVQDEKERKTVLDLMAGKTQERIYPVGRLDKNTTGLLLLTNDGDLAEKLAHPSHKVQKFYHVILNQPVSVRHLNEIKAGVELEDGIAEVDAVGHVDGRAHNEVGIEIHSGKNRIVRRIFEHLGYEVERLDRTYYAGLTKKDLPRGWSRPLTKQEVLMLKHFT